MGAEGATAPETLRQKDREGSIAILWKESPPRLAGAAEGGSPGMGVAVSGRETPGGSSQVSATEGAPLLVHF